MCDIFQSTYTSTSSKELESLNETLTNAINNTHIGQNNESVPKEWYEKLWRNFQIPI
ncbi:hypothetical protein C1645_839289 [Glomus cerebriforme]|uniref:Uncharacterized protein n=1 Tax=Glomus cerebriforme TaxID=658196 RepID=A0A397SCK7_9GLOM|nr:hypothetical protein C1645_839289 [Glomus cerebriforme]